MPYEKKFLIGGEWRSSSAAQAIRNPFTGELVGTHFVASPDDISNAIRYAEEGFRELSSLPSHERAAALRSVVECIKLRREEFVSLIIQEAGKPLTFARTEVDRSIATFTLAAEESTRIAGEFIPLDNTPAGNHRKGIVNRFPIGTIACITPYNYPLNLVAHKIAPAIASGNSFILKPSSLTPLTSLLLGDCLVQSGLPKKVLNIIPCPSQTAELLVTDERIAMLTFTGSARVGWSLREKAGKKKVTLELGGNAAVIIDRGTDLEFAARRCALGAFAYAGQVCIKVQRIYIHNEIYNDFKRIFLEVTKSLTVGDPALEQTVVGPMISSTEAERVETWVNEAVAGGATLLSGGKRHGCVYEPTVLESVKDDMKVCSEEIFGPVVTLDSWSSLDEVIEKVNRSKYGLQAGIFSPDQRTIMKAYKEIIAGGIIANDYPTFRVDSMPYGGMKDSGTGREGIRYAIHEMTEPKLLVIDF